MKLFISEISDDRRELEVEQLFLQEELTPEATLTGHNMMISFYKAGDVIALSIKGEAETRTLCNRCAEAIEVSFDVDEKFYVFPQSHEESVDYIYSGDTLVLDDFIHEALVMTAPAYILCDDDCKGRCPRCGVDLNTTTCHCETDMNKI